MMKVGWIYPFRKRCGIRSYGENYVNILKNKIEIITLNPEHFLTLYKFFKDEIKKCDIVHIQYEPSIFWKASKNFYLSLINTIKVPIVITLHEVYEQDPFVYPKEKIKGVFPLRLIRKIIWNITHPNQCSYILHMSKKFGATKILVHHYYHRDILIKKGIPQDIIEVFPMYVKKVEFNNIKNRSLFKQPLKLGSHGFINPTYNYDLLFSTLSKLEIPWNFTWVGGLRLNEHRNLLKEIVFRINKNGWQDRFKITGWISEEKVTEKLIGIDIVLAFFKVRSSSSSITRALGCYRPIIATDIPLVREIVTNHLENYEIPPIIVTKDEPTEIVNIIEILVRDNIFLAQLEKSICKFTETYSLEKMSERLITLYREIVEK